MLDRLLLDCKICIIFPAVITCPLLEAPVNGIITYSVDTESEGIGFGVSATYSCNHESLGLRGGDRVRVCGPDGDGDRIGKWSEEGPTCEGYFVLQINRLGVTRLCMCFFLQLSSVLISLIHSMDK